MKHSPGPWRWDPDGVHGPGSMLDANGQRVIETEERPHGEPWDVVVRNGADAALIAAAPRMLELLRLWARLDPDRRGDPYRLTAETYSLLTELGADK